MRRRVLNECFVVLHSDGSVQIGFLYQSNISNEYTCLSFSIGRLPVASMDVTLFSIAHRAKHNLVSFCWLDCTSFQLVLVTYHLLTSA